MKSTLAAPSLARSGAGQAGSDSLRVRPMRPGKVVPGLYSFSAIAVVSPCLSSSWRGLCPRRSRPRGRQAEQAHGILPEGRALVGLAEPGAADRGDGFRIAHSERKITAQQEAIGSHDIAQEREGPRRVSDRVVVETPRIAAGRA